MWNTPTSTIFTGQAKIASANTAVNLGANTGLQNGITIKADKNNTSPVYVGTSTVTDTGGGTGNGFGLYPGDSVSVAVTNLNALYINGLTPGDFVTWMAN